MRQGTAEDGGECIHYEHDGTDPKGAWLNETAHMYIFIKMHHCLDLVTATRCVSIQVHDKI